MGLFCAYEWNKKMHPSIQVFKIIPYTQIYMCWFREKMCGMYLYSEENLNRYKFYSLIGSCKYKIHQIIKN